MWGSLVLLAAAAAIRTAPSPPPVLPPGQPTDTCIDDEGKNVSCGPHTSQRCQRQEIWPRPVYHVMDFFCGENDPNGPFVSEHGVYHLFYQVWRR